MNKYGHVFLNTTTVCLLMHLGTVAAGDPQIESWLTSNSGRYARIYTSTANQTAGNAAINWSNGSQTQSLPAYSGVQELYSSTNWIYLRTTGLGQHVMGPWPANFPNLPVNQHSFYRFPRTPSVPATKALTGLGSIGYFVDGVAMFDSRDGFAWNGTGEGNGNGTASGYWNREAYVNEGATFDPAYAHQENSGTYHYHANPVALRYLLGDHVDFNSTTKTYFESATAASKHSPILGWVRDGFPIYGPYAYANATNSASGVRRMLSGFQLRNGQRGSDQLSAIGRSTIPAWAIRHYGVAATQSGPAVSATYPLGRYLEDNAYLGDLGGKIGVDFDLDEYNGRFGVTPDFPQGTYAYFVSIAADGTPVFPYNIGRSFYGTPSGSAVTQLGEAVTTNYLGGPKTPLVINPPTLSPPEITLVWSAVEGGTYQVESSPNLKTWTTHSATLIATENQGRQIASSTNDFNFYRITQTALAAYDSVTNATATSGGGPALASVKPNIGSRNSTVLVTITLGQNPPPANLAPTAAQLGLLKGTQLKRTGPTTVTAQFEIPANATLGAVTVGVVFPGPPGMNEVTFSLENGFTIE